MLTEYYTSIRSIALNICKEYMVEFREYLDTDALKIVTETINSLRSIDPGAEEIQTLEAECTEVILL